MYVWKKSEWEKKTRTWIHFLLFFFLYLLIYFIFKKRRCVSVNGLDFCFIFFSPSLLIRKKIIYSIFLSFNEAWMDFVSLVHLYFFKIILHSIENKSSISGGNIPYSLHTHLLTTRPLCVCWWWWWHLHSYKMNE